MRFIKENLRVIIAVFIALTLIAICTILLAIYDDTKENNKQENIKEQIIEITGMTSDDAIDIVKDNFYSNNYEFMAEATSDSLYKVIVTNIIDNGKTIYYVDPSNGQSYIDIDTN